MASHLSIGDLERLGQGRLGDPEATAVSSHLKSCPECQKKYEECSANQALAEQLRDAVEDEPIVNLPGQTCSVPEEAPQRLIPRHEQSVDWRPDAGAEPPSLETNIADPNKPPPIPDYELLEFIGKGGFGFSYTYTIRSSEIREGLLDENHTFGKLQFSFVTPFN